MAGLRKFASKKRYRGKRKRANETRGRKKARPVENKVENNAKTNNSSSDVAIGHETTTTSHVLAQESATDEIVPSLEVAAVTKPNKLMATDTPATTKKFDLFKKINWKTGEFVQLPTNTSSSTTNNTGTVSTNDDENSAVANSSAIQYTESEFLIVQSGSLNKLLDSAICPMPNCQHSGLDVKLGQRFGYAVKMKLYCRQCQTELNEQFSSPRINEGVSCGPFDVNRRAVLAASEIGIGCTGLSTLTGVQNIVGSLHHKTYASISKTIHDITVNTTNINSLADSHLLVHAAYRDIGLEPIDGALNIGVSFDGSWHKRGHTSLYGIGFVIDNLTGLIMDYEIKSKYCFECAVVGGKLNGDEKQQWLETHSQRCHKNFDGPSGNMEAAMAVALWNRSIDVCGCRYTSFVGDGDSKNFNDLIDLNPYGEKYKITKEECINHIQKRMFTGLEKTAMDCKSEGINIRGRGKVTKHRMLRWQSYFRNAITSNETVEEMQSAIWAILFHSCETSGNLNVQHGRCGDWCWYQTAVKEGRNPEDVRREKQIDPELPNEIGQRLIPLFRRLTDVNLLQRCAKKMTQNTNESFHNMVWRKIPKIKFVTLPTLETAVCMSIMEFNRGRAATIQMQLHDLGMEFGVQTTAILVKRDKYREKCCKRKSTENAKQVRIQKKLKKRGKEDAEDEEKQKYGSGICQTLD